MKNTFLFATLVMILTPTLSGQSQTFYINTAEGCSDTVGSGTQAKPYCSVKYAATIAKAGDTFLVQAGMYSQGPTVFNRPGTATAPITWRAVGDVVFGLDLRDEDFQPVPGMPHVYSIPWTHPIFPNHIVQSHYAPILIDDPNQTKFTLVQEDGPLRLAPVDSDTLLLAHEGTWDLKPGGQLLYVRAYGDRVPSTADTNFVAGVNDVIVDTKAQYNVFDGFRIVFSFTVVGSNNTFRNLKFSGGQTFDLRGSNNTVEDITITHVIGRDATTFSWVTDGQGTGGGASGPGHRVKNIQVWHNWNSTFSGEKATGLVIDGARLHGAPNHCSVGANGNAIIRNMVMFNCQDVQWLIDTNGLTMEHVVIPTGIGLSAVTRTLGPVIIRNSIINGGLVFVRGPATLPLQGCTWEKGSILENSVIAATATIQRCANQIRYPVLTYMAKCAAGEFVDAAGVPDCMTIRNNRLVSPTEWKTVLKDGMWPGTLQDRDVWDVTLVPGSPAIDAGTTSGATTDIAGNDRPQGVAKDAGAYEFTSSAAPVPVDCVVSECGAWQATGPWVVANWIQTRTEQCTRTVTTPPANGGAACPALSESRTVTQACQSLTVTPDLQVVCNPAPSGQRPGK